MCLMTSEVGFVIASLLLVSELLRENGDLRQAIFGGVITQKATGNKFDAAGDDSDEAFVDVDKQITEK